MFITIINDCCDDNAIIRQETLVSALFSFFHPHVSTMGIGFGKTIQAAGNLIDVLGVVDSLNDITFRPGIILVNSAPRQKKQWPNGTPFGFFKYKEVIVITSVDEYTLSLVKKLKLVNEIELLDVSTVIDWAVQQSLIKKSLGDRIKVTQFRSLEFTPRVAEWLLYYPVPSTKYQIDNIQDIPNAVWHIDNFGNCKTTMLPEDINFKPGNEVEIKGVHIKCYQYLKDVPSGELAIIQGSSGIGDKKFLEIVINGDSVAKVLGIKVGDAI